MQNQILLISFVTIYVRTVLTIHILCNQQSIDQLDNNLRKLAVLGDPRRMYPVNDKALQNHCQTDNEMVVWGRNYTSTCLIGRQKETSRHVTNLMMYAINKLSKKICRTEFTRKLFVNAGKCGNLAKDDTTKCYYQYVLEAEQINRSKKSRITNEKHLLPLICCAYHKFYDCASDVYSQPNYSRLCTQKATVELEAYIRESLYDVIQYLCGDYQGSSDKCDKLRDRYHEVFNSKVKNLPKSPLSSAIEIFDSIPPLKYN